MSCNREKSSDSFCFAIEICDAALVVVAVVVLDLVSESLDSGAHSDELSEALSAGASPPGCLRASGGHDWRGEAVFSDVGSRKMVSFGVGMVVTRLQGDDDCRETGTCEGRSKQKWGRGHK